MLWKIPTALNLSSSKPGNTISLNICCSAQQSTCAEKNFKHIVWCYLKLQQPPHTMSPSPSPLTSSGKPRRVKCSRANPSRADPVHVGSTKRYQSALQCYTSAPSAQTFCWSSAVFRQSKVCQVQPSQSKPTALSTTEVHCSVARPLPRCKLFVDHPLSTCNPRRVKCS